MELIAQWMMEGIHFLELEFLTPMELVTGLKSGTPFNNGKKKAY